MKISKLQAREILDSRGNPTIKTYLTVNSGGREFSCWSSVPAGASKGKYEAKELRDGGARYGGLGVRKAVANVNDFLAKRLKGQSVARQSDFDELLIKLDGTPDKSRLGANALLSVSLAAARARAAANGLPVFQELNSKARTLPVPVANLINGGLHAGGARIFQEYLVLPTRARNFGEATQAVAETYHALREQLKQRFGSNATLVGDEGGFSPPFADVVDPLSAIQAAAKEAGWSDKIALGLDCAATTLFNGREKKYAIAGRSFDAGALVDFYAELAKTFRLAYLEDPFHEDDWSAFKTLGSKMKGKTMVVGDDLTASNPSRVQEAVRQTACHGIILKPNQVGTLTEAVRAAEIAKSGGLRVIVSHRSGETTDSFIADLAVGLETGFAKIGAPARGERVAKWNRLLKIEETLGRNARFAKA